MTAKRVTATGPVEGPWALPDGWRWDRLRTIGRWGSGGTPKAKTPKFYGGGIPWYKIGDLTDGVLRGSADTITQAGLDASSAKWVPSGALLLAMYGSIGKLGLTIEPVTTNQAIAFCVPDDRCVDRKYLFYFLLFRRTHLLSLGQGGTQQNISQTILLEEPVPLPELDEQTRIAARIDELFVEIDDGEAALTRAREDLATWRKALLKAAVTGQLTADWRAANPPTEMGADLSDRILADRARVASKRLGKRRDKAPEEISPAQERLLWAAPDGWAWMQLGTFSFVTKLAGFEYTKFVRYDDDGDLRVIKAENAGLHGFKPTNYSRVRSACVAELTRSRLHGGELLMVFVGAGTGNVATVPEGEDFFLGPNIGMMRVETDIVSPRFVELYLRSPVGKSLATAAMKAVAQPSLSMGTIRQIPVLLPPAAEQEEILRRLEQAMTAAADCGTDVRDQQTYAATLRQSILAAAVRGELS